MEKIINKPKNILLIGLIILLCLTLIQKIKDSKKCKIIFYVDSDNNATEHFAVKAGAIGDSLGNIADSLKNTSIGKVGGSVSVGKLDTGKAPTLPGAKVDVGAKVNTGGAKVDVGAKVDIKVDKPKINAKGDVEIKLDPATAKTVGKLAKLGEALKAGFKKGGKWAKANPKAAAAVLLVGGFLAYATVISIRDGIPFSEALGKAAKDFGETAGSIVAEGTKLAGNVVGGALEGAFGGMLPDWMSGGFMNPYGYGIIGCLVCISCCGSVFQLKRFL